MKKIVPSNAILIPDNAKCVFKGVIFDVFQWPQAMFDGTSATFEMIRRQDTVEIIAVKNGKIVVLEEEQPNLSPYLSLPAGRKDSYSEPSLDAAKRELAEETGLYFKTWKLLSVAQPAAKGEWFIYQYLATDLVKEEASQPEADGEKIKVMEKTVTELKELFNHPLNRWLPKDLFENIETLDDLLAMPEFEGQEVDRSHLL